MKEVSTAVIEVGNGMFGRKWKRPEDSEESFDIDTSLNIRNIRRLRHRAYLSSWTC